VLQVTGGAMLRDFQLSFAGHGAKPVTLASPKPAGLQVEEEFFSRDANKHPNLKC